MSSSPQLICHKFQHEVLPNQLTNHNTILKVCFSKPMGQLISGRHINTTIMTALLLFSHVTFYHKTIQKWRDLMCGLLKYMLDTFHCLFHILSDMTYRKVHLWSMYLCIYLLYLFWMFVCTVCMFLQCLSCLCWNKLAKTTAIKIRRKNTDQAMAIIWSPLRPVKEKTTRLYIMLRITTDHFACI